MTFLDCPQIIQALYFFNRLSSVYFSFYLDTLKKSNIIFCCSSNNNCWFHEKHSVYVLRSDAIFNIINFTINMMYCIGK